jgi:nucleotide-binding universal stress UspA family protein
VPEGFAKVLVGSDGSDRAAVAVGRAVDVASALGASLTILGVGDPTRLQPKLDALADACAGAPISIETQVEKGHPASVLIDVAREGGYDLLVVGNKGMAGLERLRLGAVPNKVSHHLPCSMLIVRTG